MSSTAASSHRCGSVAGVSVFAAATWTSFLEVSTKLGRSEARTAYESALNEASRALRRDNDAAAAAVLRELATAATDLARELDAPEGERHSR
jgi:type II secretory pathway component PulJ